MVTACGDGPAASRPSLAATIAIVDGDGQTGVAGKPVATPLEVRVSDARGQPVRGVGLVVIASNGGSVTPPGGSTDANGIFRAPWQLGASAGGQTARVQVVSLTSGGALEVTFRAVAMPSDPASVEIETAAPEPIEPVESFTHTVVARVFDGFHNPVPGATLVWTASTEGATLAAATTVARADGSAENQWTVRASEGSLLASGTYSVTVQGVDGSGTRPIAPAVRFEQFVGGPRISAASVSVGGRQACALTLRRGVYCWSIAALTANPVAGTSEPVSVATPVPGTESFAAVAVGGTHTCALDGQGKPYCWGTNDASQLGDGTRRPSAVPVAVTGAPALSSLVAGALHTCGLTEQGDAYCWGSNGASQLGVSDTSATVGRVAGKNFVSLAAGPYRTCGLTSDGDVSCWGTRQGFARSPVASAGPCAASCVAPSRTVERITQVAAGANVTCTLDNGGSVLCSLGFSDPLKVPALPGRPFVTLAAGPGDAVCGLSAVGTASCWQVDFSYYDTLLTGPSPVGGSRSYAAIALGDGFMCGIDWGSSRWVTCGRGNREPAFVLLPVTP